MNAPLPRRSFLATLATAFLARAFAQRGAAFPADALSKIELWDDAAFLADWRAPDANTRIACRLWPGEVELFGVKAHGASAFIEAGRLRSISVLFLDAGTWAGFGTNEGVKSESEFLALHTRAAADVTAGLAALGRGRDVPLGGKSLLKHTARIAQHGGVWSRLVVWPGQLVKLFLFRNEDAATQLLAPSRRAPKREEQAKAFAALVRVEKNGDRVIDGIPVLPQGNRAYCGMSALAMAMQHLGLRVETEELAAAAGIGVAGTQDAKTRETYTAAGDLSGLNFDRAQRFELGRARTALDAGLPVIVFRHWSQERDFIHTAFSRRFAKDATATLPRADMNDRKLWPQRGGFAHATIVNGYNDARREVIFTESWSEAARDRRMRVEEMEGTAYMAYYPKL